MGDNTHSLVEVAQKIYDIYTDHLPTLGVDARDLFWGDQNKIPRSPAICVDAQGQEIELAGIGGGGRVEIIHEVHIILYFAKLADSQELRREADAFAEAAKNVLHTPGQGLTNTIGDNGVVLAGNVVRLNNGYATRQGGLYRASLLVWQGKCKTSIIP